MDIIAMCGLLLCRLLVSTGLGSIAPAVCFGGDTSAIGLETLVLLVLAIVAACGFGYRAAGNSSIVMIIVAMSVLAAGSAAIVHYVAD
ncbi:MAG TPA: hypothetical protein VGF92_09410 [Stellaceae bacterium]|jgi:hypothetical protein